MSTREREKKEREETPNHHHRRHALTPPPPSPQAAPYVCLVRAADSRRKIATAVPAKDAARFVESYGTILKAHMDGLKKKEKAKKAGGGGGGGKK